MDTEQAAPRASFSQLLDRGLALPPARALWCPTMDLLAVLTSDGQLQLYRLNWQRLWSITPESPITSLCWRPDGKQIAVGQHDGSVLLLDTEDGGTQERAHIFENPVDALTWTFSALKTSPGQPIIQYNDRTRNFFEPPLPPAPAHTAPTASGFDNYAERLGKREEASWPPKLDTMGLIACGSSIGEVALCGEGLFLLAKHRIFASKIIHKMEIPPSLAEVAIRWVTEAGDEVLSLVDISFLAGSAQHTLRMLCSYASDTKRSLRTCRTIIWQMWKEWQSVQTAMNEFKATLNELLKQHGVESDAQSDLLLLVTMGEYTPPMEQFLMNALGEAGIKKIARGVDAALCAMHALIVDRLQPELEMVTFRLGELRGLAANPMNRKLLNLRVSEVATAEKSALKLIIQAEFLRDRVTQGVSQYRTFFSWLTTALRRFPEDTVDTMMGYPLSHVDAVREFLHYEFDKSVIEPFLFGGDPNSRPQEYFSPEKEPVFDPTVSLNTADQYHIDGDTYDYWGDEVEENTNFCEEDILEEIAEIFSHRQVLDSDVTMTEGREMAILSAKGRASGTGMVRDIYYLQNEVLTALVRPSLGMSTRLYTPGRAETVHWMFVRKDATSTSADAGIPGVLQYSSVNGELTAALPVEIPAAAAAAAAAGAAEKDKKKTCLALMTCSARQFSKDPIYLEPTQSELEKAKSDGGAAGALTKMEINYNATRQVKFSVTPFSEGVDLVDVGYYKDGALALLLENQQEKTGASDAHADAVLALAPRDLFINTMHPVSITQLNSMIPAFEAYGVHISPSPLDVEGCRQRALPYRYSKRPMAISATRGIAFVLAGNKRALLYDLEEDEEVDEGEDGEEETGMADNVEEERREEQKDKQEQQGEGLISEKELEEMSVSRMTQLLLGNDAAAAAAAATIVPGGDATGPIEEPQAAVEEESESESSEDAPRFLARRPRRRS